MNYPEINWLLKSISCTNIVMLSMSYKASEMKKILYSLLTYF